jgi:cephalosporin hydroxylase
MNVAVSNIEKCNIHKNFHKYIKGNSHNPKTLEFLLEILTEIDVLFIDGDHSVTGVKKDFEIYEKFVKLGGYVVFDDYNDHRHSPDVKIGVDSMIKSIEEKYEIIGTLPNTYGAKPAHKKEGNCFIIKKKNG